MYFGFIGLGQAGGNISDLAAKHFYTSTAINYSETDLKSVNHIPDEMIHTLIGSEGIGKDRELAKQLMRDNWESTVSFVKKHLSKPSIEVIFVPFGTAGGSGSGMSSLLLEILTNEMPDKTFVACPILPANNETLNNKLNALEALSELADLDFCTIPIDNNTVLANSDSFISKNIIYKKTNEEFISLINKLLEYTNKSSENGVIDRKDLRQIFSVKGISVIGAAKVMEVSGTSLKTEHFAKKIQESWINSIFSPIEYDQVIRAGIIFNGDDLLMEYMDYDEIFKVFKTKKPYDLFEGNYKEKRGEVISVLSGLPWINSRMQELDNLADTEEMALSNVNVSEYKPKSRKKTIVTSRSKTTKTKSNPTDVFNKYLNR